MRIIGQCFHISDESHWQFMLQVYCVISCLTSPATKVLSLNRIKAGCRDRGSSLAAAVIVYGFYASNPCEMLLTREFNQLISQCGMCIPIAFCFIAIVVVVWPAVGLCFPAKTFFSVRFVVMLTSHPPSSHD